MFPQTSFNLDWQSTAPGCHSASFKWIWFAFIYIYIYIYIYNNLYIVSRWSDVVLQNKSPPNLIFYLFFLWFWIALKKETPCFHRGVSIQIDSPLPQGVTQPVSRGSDVALHNKNPPNLIFYLFCLEFWIALKKETPCFHIRVSIQIDSPLLQGVTQPVTS